MGSFLRDIISGDDQLDRSCKEIPEEACCQQRWNFTANTANGAASKLAEQLAGPNLVLPWLLQVLGSPVWMLGFLMPIKQSFSLLPQMIVAGRIRQLTRRKWVWTGAALVQALTLLLLIPAALWLSPMAAGLVLLGLFLLFSLASGTASVAFQDVIGKTIDKGHRGRLLARRALLGGLLTMVAGLLLSRGQDGGGELGPLLLLLSAAALLWVLAALFFALIREAPGSTDGGRNVQAEVRTGMGNWRRYPGFRQFVRVRGLLLTVELATPFLVLYAAQLLNLQLGNIGALVIAVGVAQGLSSPFWGRMADRTSKRVMRLSALLGTGAVLLMLLVGLIPLVPVQTAGCLIAFVLIGLAETGARLGRKTYLVDATPQDERASFTAFSNSLIGVLALLSGLAGLVAQWFGPALMLIALALLMALAAVACAALPEADAMLANNSR